MATDYDAQLHVLRSVARATDDNRQRQEIESARFNLYAALETRDRDAARQWSRALRVALDVLRQTTTQPAAVALALDALDEIEAGITGT